MRGGWRGLSGVKQKEQNPGLAGCRDGKPQVEPLPQTGGKEASASGI